MYPYSPKRAHRGKYGALRSDCAAGQDRTRQKSKINDRIKRHNPGTVKTAPGLLFLILFHYTDNLILLQEPAADDKIIPLLSPILATGRG